MESRIMQVFYGNDCLPYKDKARTVHYPIVGNSFTGANNTTQVRFYVDKIGGATNVTWIAVTKLPSGQIGNEVLSNVVYDNELGEYYVTLDLSSFYTSLKGDVYISLNGYQGGITVEENDDVYEISGTPTIQATGAIKITMNYAPQTLPGAHFAESDLQQILALFSEYARVDTTFTVIANNSVDISGYDDDQLFYVVDEKRFYKKVSGDLEYLNFVTNNQTNVSIIRDVTTNINGWVLSNYTYTTVTVSGAQAYKILRGGNALTEEYAITYMKAMCGSSYLPRYDYNVPANTFFLKPDGTLLKPQYDSTNGLLLFIMPQLATKSYVDNLVTTNYVPYSGATQDVNLGTHDLKANAIKVNDDYHLIDVVSGDLVLGTGTGDIYLQPDGEVKVGSDLNLDGYDLTVDDINLGESEGSIVTDESGILINSAKSIYLNATNKNYKVNTSGGYEDIATKQYVDSKVSSVYKYKGSKTVAQINALNSTSTVGDVYNVSDSGTLTQGSVHVVAGDNVAWTGSVWDKLASDIDLSNYYTKSETNTLLNAKQDTLVSGTNIKTINNQSLLGSGNIDIQGGGAQIDWATDDETYLGFGVWNLDEQTIEDDTIVLSADDDVDNGVVELA